MNIWLRNGFKQALLGLVWGMIALAGWWFSSPAKPSAESLSSTRFSVSSDDEVFAPLPDPVSIPFDARRVALGRLLFHDTRFSADNRVSCASCHDLGTGGVDLRAHSVVVSGRIGVINSPTVYNSGFNFAQFWDGRAATLEEQISGPITSPHEFGSDWPTVLSKLNADASLRAAFQQAYADGLNARTVSHAIAEFERSLITPSRFDRFLRGDTRALTPVEKRGYELFRSYGCMNCHQGMNIGGNLYQRLGVMRNYFAGRVSTPADQGRYNITRHAGDMHVFKVPSLRNVALTPPYFHDASIPTLDEAVMVMARYQLGVELPQNDREALVAFLYSLNGEGLER